MTAKTANAAANIQAIVYSPTIHYHGTMGRGYWGEPGQPLAIHVLLLVNAADLQDALLTLREYRKASGELSIRRILEDVDTDDDGHSTLGGVVGDVFVVSSEFHQLEGADMGAPRFGCEFVVHLAAPEEE